jgi:predicted amidohydrolase
MSRIVRVAATQMSCSFQAESNFENAKKLVRSAAAQGAQIILLQELFHTVYFCQVSCNIIFNQCTWILFISFVFAGAKGEVFRVGYDFGRFDFD